MSNPVKPIPENYHSITPNLVCHNAAKAIDFYKAVFGATEIMRMPGPDGKIMHAELKIGDSPFFLNDTMSKTMPAGPEPGVSNPTYLHVYVTDVDSVFNRAFEGGSRVELLSCVTRTFHRRFDQLAERSRRSPRPQREESPACGRATSIPARAARCPPQ